MARALYAWPANDQDLELMVGEMKTRAERKLGQLSAQLEKKPGTKNNTTYGNVATGSSKKVIPKKHVLAELGVTERHASRCEKLADIPEEKFEAKLTDAVERVKNPPKRTRKRAPRKDVDPETTRKMLEKPKQTEYQRNVEVSRSVFTASRLCLVNPSPDSALRLLVDTFALSASRSGAGIRVSPRSTVYPRPSSLL